MKTIPYGKQSIDAADMHAVISILKSDFLTQGPMIKQFEDAIARFCNVHYAVAFSSGTAALHGACFAAGISSGDEVITTPMTFAASANCVVYVGATPVFADIRQDIPLIDPQEIEKKITKKTRAIIPVDYAGVPCDYDAITKIAIKHNLVVIADAAHSLGATYRGKTTGSLADMTVFSFHPVKLITTGEGGMVTTNNKKYYERLLVFRTHGITKERSQMTKKSEGQWYYEMQHLGFNYRLTDIQAALGLSQFKRIKQFLNKRRRIAQQYITAFSKNPLVKSLIVPHNRVSAWHLFPIQVQNTGKKNSRKKIFVELHQRNIKVQVHYIPIHLHPYYQKRFGFRKGDFPNSEQFYDTVLSLPMYPSLGGKELHRVIQRFQEILLQCSK